MPNAGVLAKVLTLRLKEKFVLAKASATEKATLIVRWREGIGEGSPSIYYGLSAQEAEQWMQSKLSAINAEWTLDELNDFLDSFPPEMSVVKCALEMAYFDYQAKLQGQPLYQYLSLQRPADVESSLTISYGSEDEIRSQLASAHSFHSLKLKLGFDRDLHFIDFVLAEGDFKLRIDVNGGWSTDQTIEKLRSLAGYPVEFVEQPITDPALRDLDKIKTKVDCTIFLDESIMTEKDIGVYHSVIDGVNLKLSRCGGLQSTIAMAGKAREYDLKLMLGCMIETAVGITAALNIASLFDYYDLDSILLTEDDPYWGAHFKGSQLLLPEGSGIGVKIHDNEMV